MALDTTGLRSRRALLVGAVGALGALAAQALGQPATVYAHDSDDVRLGGDNVTTTSTTIYKANALGGETLGVSASGGVTAVAGYAADGDGVLGSSGSGTGVSGISMQPGGIGVRGESQWADTTSIYGLKQTTGPAVWGEIKYAASGWGAVFGRTNGKGPGVIGESTADGEGTWGRALGTGDGIYGESTKGRGGRFKGKKAAIRLDPSTAATHPRSGAAGDLFVDASMRLWFCKGGTTWVKLA